MIGQMLSETGRRSDLSTRSLKRDSPPVTRCWSAGKWDGGEGRRRARASAKKTGDLTLKKLSSFKYLSFSCLEPRYLPIQYSKIVCHRWQIPHASSGPQTNTERLHSAGLTGQPAASDSARLMYSVRAKKQVRPKKLIAHREVKSCPAVTNVCKRSAIVDRGGDCSAPGRIV